MCLRQLHWNSCGATLPQVRRMAAHIGVSGRRKLRTLAFGSVSEAARPDLTRRSPPLRRRRWSPLLPSSSCATRNQNGSLGADGRLDLARLSNLSATSLEDARSLLVEPAANGTTPVTCWSIPITVGTWTIPLKHLDWETLMSFAVASNQRPLIAGVGMIRFTKPGQSDPWTSSANRPPPCSR